MALSPNARGAVYMNLSMAAFTLNDTAMKTVTETLPLFQTIGMRGILSVLGLAVLAAATTGLALRLRGPAARMTGLRAGAEVFATALFLAALVQMPLANLSAILQALPLAVTLAAAVVFGERVGWRRMTAILVGFAGVMMILRPGGAEFGLWSLMGVGSMLCVVVRDLATRRLPEGTPTATVALWSAIAVTAMGLAGTAVQGWQVPNGREAGLVAVAAGFLIVGYVCGVNAMRHGEVGAVAPFRYTSLLWAIVLGWLVFGTFPDGWTLAGAALVVASGIFTLVREARLGRRGRVDTPADSP
jgi:drug/metabolite transporter (DMT)-like permease